jgi:hypothetical protein
MMAKADGGFFDRPVHSLNLAVGPRMIDLCKVMLNEVFPAAHIEHMRHVAGSRAIGIERRKSELNAIAPSE